MLCEKKREYLLIALDMLGKWTLIDTFVMTLMLVSFHFHLQMELPDTTPPEYASADVFVEPQSVGFYSYESFESLQTEFGREGTDQRSSLQVFCLQHLENLLFSDF